MITATANQALHAATEAAEERAADFYRAQEAVLADLAARTNVDITDSVERESHPPPIPEHLRTEDGFRGRDERQD